MADNVIPLRDGVPSQRLALHHSSRRLEKGAALLRALGSHVHHDDGPLLKEMADFLEYCSRDMKRELGGFL